MCLQAESHGVVWGMERCTFRSIIVVSTMEKRQRYEASLSSMPLFAALSLEQRAIIADCLSLETFEVFSAALALMQHIIGLPCIVPGPAVCVLQRPLLRSLFKHLQQQELCCVMFSCCLMIHLPIITKSASVQLSCRLCK